MIKKLSLVSLFTLLSASLFYAQTTVYAYIKDSEGKPVESAEVSLKGSGNDVVADKIGYFQFVDLKPGHYQVVVAKQNYETKVLDFEVEKEKRIDLGVITLSGSLGYLDQGYSVIDSGNSQEESTNQSTVGLLQSSQDVFSRIASFDLGNYWFRPRGVDGRTVETMMNGTPMASADDGNVDFSNWGGLNEITRYPEIAQNHAPSDYAFGGISSVIYKNTKASEYRKGSQFTYSITNRNYRNRLSYRYSSGMSKSGWAFTGMIARRWAQEGIQEGTYYDAFGGYLGIEKKLSDQHTITLNAFGSPYRRSTSSPNTQEAYDYRGIHYNSYWGWHDGEKLSERVRRGFTPIIQFSDYWTMSKKASLWTSISYQFGKSYASRLDWYKANNPSPTYYKNLPSYWLNRDPSPTDYDVAKAGFYDAAWRNNDQSITQLNWDNIYAANYNSKYSTAGSAGRAAYWLVDDASNDKIWNASTHFTYNFNDVTKFILNINYQNYYSEQYREVKDLLGADYAVNLYSFNDGASSGMYNTLDANVNKTKGDKIGYDYIFRKQEIMVNPGLKFSVKDFDVFLSALYGYNSNSREGLFSHYLYKNSYGKSIDHNFWNAGLKGQVVYRVNGRNFLVYNGAYYSQTPFLNNIYINARVSNVVTPNIRNTVVNANDLSYVINSPIFKMRFTGYLIETQNETEVQRFYADISGGIATTSAPSSFVTEVLSGVSKRNMGLELGIQYKITPTLTASGLATVNQHTYTNNPNLYFVVDNPSFYDATSSIVLADYSNNYKNMGVAYLKNYKQGDSPQEAYSLGLRYSSPKYWWLGATWNYLGHNYLSPSPATRTDLFYTDSVSGTPYPGVTQDILRQLLAPVKLPSAYFFNVNAGKSWLLGKNYFLISATVNNVFNNQKYITGGFEQVRNGNFVDYSADMANATPSFAPKYFYNQGRSYFVNFQLRF